MRHLSLSRSVTVTLDSTGAGTAQIGPAAAGESWQPGSVNVSMTGDIPTGVATCFIYAGGSVSAATFIDSTYDVLGASSSMIAGKTLYPGQYVFAVWTAGNAGASATLAVNGTRTVP